MKSPAELAALLRERLIHSRPHYDINGQPLRAIVVTQEWLEDMADAANALDGCKSEIECTCAAKDMAFGRCCKLDESLTDRELQNLRNDGGLQERAADEIEALRCKALNRGMAQTPAATDD